MQKAKTQLACLGLIEGAGNDSSRGFAGG
ncbi:uncharacterized protein METZ01_LOCUS434304 [marine metagenome]|uniref:Uncharacterized protein n=1 Tax=marine metagenome TaxID=408172 RepID=A0A382YED7_9ZZZZ